MVPPNSKGYRFLVRSMTGFGRAEYSGSKGRCAVEIRSLNHRFLEVSVRLQPFSSILEEKVREKIQQRLKRGKVTVSITFSVQNAAVAPKGFIWNEALLRHYLKLGRYIHRKYKLPFDLTVRDIFSLPYLVTWQEVESASFLKEWGWIEKVLNKALLRLEQARQREGKKLARDIAKRLSIIQKAIEAIAKNFRGQENRIYGILKERLKKMVDGEIKDEERIFREAALLAQKADITEEIVRLRSHVDLFKKRLASNAAGGRELDFIVQEMYREVNTLSSKAELFSVSKMAVQVKSELEKIKEQIQNLE